MQTINQTSSQSFLNDLIDQGESIGSIAKATGISTTSIKRLMNNKQQNIRFPKFIKLIHYWCLKDCYT